MQTTHMQNTLDQFRSFLRPNTQQSSFNINESIQSVLLLTNDELMKYSIKLVTDFKVDVYLTGLENEFKHVILNFISNSKDAFLQNNIEKRYIQIQLFEKDKKIIVCFKDNAGGVPSHIIDSIFNANVTSKSSTGGTGIGLYLTKQIINKLHGKIKVFNDNVVFDGETYYGACFNIEFDRLA